MKTTACRIIALALIALYLAACSATTVQQPLGVNTGNDLRKVNIVDEDVYTIKFIDGRQHVVQGNALKIDGNSIWAWSTPDHEWKRYDRSEVDDIYIDHTDHQKAHKRKVLITSAAVLAAFAAAAAGGYFIEKKVMP